MIKTDTTPSVHPTSGLHGLDLNTPPVRTRAPNKVTFGVAVSKASDVQLAIWREDLRATYPAGVEPARGHVIDEMVATLVRVKWKPGMRVRRS